MIPISRETRAEAWLAAAEIMNKSHKREYNVILEVAKPGLATTSSRTVEREVDSFLRKYEAQPTHTVAETIFPATEYTLGGINRVYDYPKNIYPHIKSIPQNSWGTYALRLTERRCSDGSHIKPLELAITKLRRQLEKGSAKRAAYELDLEMEPLELKLYSAEDDHSRIRGGQCLSHISLKLGPKRELYLTAMYRYQYFVQKALGNLLGLARLQAAIAREVGISVGPLVCHATMAILEDHQLDNQTQWKHAEVDALLKSCKSLIAIDPVEPAA